MKKDVALEALKQIELGLKSEPSRITTCFFAARSLVKELFETENPHYRTISDSDKFNIKAQRQVLLSEIESIITELEHVDAEELPVPKSKDNVFIVHGSDNETKEMTDQFLKELGLKPIILHEQPNKGLTIIEKLEIYSSNADFAVVLLTPDDIGGSKSDLSSQSPRARQNVVFEFGYFCGKIGRDKVCALYQGVEQPSDLHGVFYIPLDESGDWKRTLVRELEAANLDLRNASSYKDPKEPR